MRTSRSSYSQDVDKEKQIGIFLDRYFYLKVGDFRVLERVRDLWRQKQGIDVIVREHDGGRRMNIDEKAQISSAGSPFPGFAFEIRNMGSGNIGWLLNENLATDAYLLVWINSLADRGNIAAEVIEEAEIMIVPKERVSNYVKGYFGDYYQNLLDMDSAFYRFIVENHAPKVNRYVFSKSIKWVDSSSNFPCYITYSPALYEKPVNFIISKDELKKLSIGNYICRKDSVLRAR